MSPETLTPESRFDFSLACDVRLGEVVRNNPAVDYIDIDPEAVRIALERFDHTDGTGPKKNLVVQASHDMTTFAIAIRQAFDDALPGMEEIEPLEKDEDLSQEAGDFAASIDPTLVTVALPVGGSEIGFIMSLHMDKESLAAASIEKYARERSLDTSEVVENLDEKVDEIMYSHPAPNADVVIQRNSLNRIQDAVDRDNSWLRKADKFYATAANAGKATLLMGGVAATGLGSYAILEPITGDSAATYVVELSAGIGWLYSYFKPIKDRLFPRIARMIPSPSDRRLDRAMHAHDIPQIVSVVRNQ